MKYVIIGNSTAGIAAVEGIRSVDQSGEIVLLSDEQYPAYGRPLISYYLWGKTDAQRMHSRPEDFYQKNGAALRLGVRAEKIDAERRKVILRGGEEVGYDRLLVATGSRPSALPVPGIEQVKNKFSFMTFDDALALEGQLSPEKRVLIIGAGLIGLKCLEGILERVGSVIVADMAGRVLPSILDEEGSAIVQAQLEAKGAKFLLADSAVSFEEGVAHMRSGTDVPFDILVVAAGVRPNVELVKDAGGEVARGIVADDRQETSLPGIFAAGDCCESYDITAGTRRVLALLPNAYKQGFAAGANMAGGDVRVTDAMPLNAIGFFGSHVLTAGSYTGESYTYRAGDRYKKLFYADGVLKGFILINMPERAGIYTALVRGRVPLSAVDFEMLKEKPCLAAFPAAERRHMLSQEV